MNSDSCTRLLKSPLNPHAYYNGYLNNIKIRCDHDKVIQESIQCVFPDTWTLFRKYQCSEGITIEVDSVIQLANANQEHLDIFKNPDRMTTHARVWKNNQRLHDYMIGNKCDTTRCLAFYQESLI